ncbi:MAG: anti-sigma factor [Variovorax sp.]|nr:MAG: anti-sigma factor [Variovorax sp.]
MNQTSTVTVREQVSALADGDLQDAELAQLIGQICADDDLRGAWRTYHLVGDVLRSGAQAPCAESAGFVARLQQRLAAEAPVSALAPAQPVVVPAMHVESARAQPREAANEPVFRWKLVAGAASLAAAAAIGWNLLGTGAVAPAPAAQLAQQQEAPSVLAASRAVASESASRLAPTRVVVGGGAPQVMLRDPRLDQLLEAHQQAGGASQMPSGFLRNATFEGAGR